MVQLTCVPENLYNKHGKAHVISSLFNRGTRVIFPKVYANSMEGLAPHMAYCIVQYDEQFRRERRQAKKKKKRAL